VSVGFPFKIASELRPCFRGLFRQRHKRGWRFERLPLSEFPRPKGAKRNSIAGNIAKAPLPTVDCRSVFDWIRHWRGLRRGVLLAVFAGHRFRCVI
jgi:hypothetical protein